MEKAKQWIGDLLYANGVHQRDAHIFDNAENNLETFITQAKEEGYREKEGYTLRDLAKAATLKEKQIREEERKKMLEMIEGMKRNYTEDNAQKICKYCGFIFSCCECGGYNKALDDLKQTLKEEL